MQGRPEGTLMGTTSEGIPVFAAYTRSAYSGWTVAVGIPRHSLLRRLNLSIVSVCVLVIVSVGVGLGVATLTARRIRGAIIAMIPAAEALSLAKTVELPEDRYEETRLLGEALKNASEKLRRSEHAAHHDLLTGLPNRAFLHAVLPAMASQAMRLQHPLTLLYLDLDGFKQVNDKLGHAAGDEVLSQTAWRIRACVRAADIGIRLGGDEFVVVLPNTGRAGALETAERIRLSVEQRMELQWGEARVSASIGLACFPEDCATVDELFYLADKAMYGAKRDGKNTVHSAVHSAAHSAAHSAEAVTLA
jgi:diguanylate cyclase (GGDEF)-like protein